MSSDRAASQQRWFGAAQLLGLVRAEPGITRALAAQKLGIGSGGATELVARMRRLRLLEETPAPAQGRGRPSTVLVPHDRGPLVLAVELRAGDWRLAIAGLDGQPQVVAESRHGGRDVAAVLAELQTAIADTYRTQRSRVCAISVSAAGTVAGSRLVQFTTRGWTDVDLSALTAGLPARAAVPLLVGNDATLAGLAEARSGAARGASTALHLIVAVGLGGTLVADGEPVMGAHGAAGEYGHIPFGDPTLRCPCGALGCWDLNVDGRALARHMGDPAPADPIEYAHAVLARQQRGEGNRRTRRALDAVATALGAGIGGLVNLHDPDAVTLGGLAVPLRAAAPDVFDAAYRDGLMAYRKSAPPPVRDGVHGEDGPLYGAIARGLDAGSSETALAAWAARIGKSVLRSAT